MLPHYGKHLIRETEEKETIKSVDDGEERRCSSCRTNKNRKLKTTHGIEDLFSTPTRQYSTHRTYGRGNRSTSTGSSIDIINQRHCWERWAWTGEVHDFAETTCYML